MKERHNKREILGVIAAAGKGSRMGLPGGKQLLRLEGKSVIARSCEVFEAAEVVDSYLVVASPEQMREMEEELSPYLENGKLQAVIPGGASRQESVFLGLRYWAYLLSAGSGSGTTVSGRSRMNCGDIRGEQPIVLIHDGARCLLETRFIDELVELTRREHCGAALAIPLTDTVRLLGIDGYIEKTIPRERLMAMQTPQASDLYILMKAIETAIARGEQMTDDLKALELIGYPVRLIQGSKRNIKLTHPEDIKLARFYLGSFDDELE